MDMYGDDLEHLGWLLHLQGVFLNKLDQTPYADNASCCSVALELKHCEEMLILYRKELEKTHDAEMFLSKMRDYKKRAAEKGDSV